MSSSMPVGTRGAGPVEGDGGSGGAPDVEGGTTDAAADADAEVDAVGIDNGSSGSIARGGCSGGLGRL